MILQLNPPIPMSTPKGTGFCHFLENLGVESDYLWTVFQDSGEIWTWRTREVRLGKNITLGRDASDLDVLGRDKNSEDIDTAIEGVKKIIYALRELEEECNGAN